jgi:predicted DNA-binding transcriptional regulator AlpA
MSAETRTPAAPAAGSCISAEEAFGLLGVDRTTGYRAIREGTFPLPVIRIGRLIKVPAAPMRHLLGLPADHEQVSSNFHADGTTPSA